MAKHNDFNKIMQRIIGQIRFVPTLSSWQDTVEVSKNFQEDFKNWRIANRQDVTLYSPEDCKLLQILYNSISYVNEKEENTKELKEKIQKSFSLINKDKDEFDYMGFRNIQIIGTKFEFNELVDLIYGKIYTSDILQISSDKVDDVVFSISSVKDEIKNRVTLGPVTKDEGLRRFNSQFVDRDYSSIMDEYKSFLYVDVDTYIKLEKGLDKIDYLIGNNLKIIDSYISYLTK